MQGSAPAAALPTGDLPRADTAADIDLGKSDADAAKDVKPDKPRNLEIENAATPVAEEDLSGTQPAAVAPPDSPDVAAGKRKSGFEPTVEDTSVKPVVSSLASQPPDIDPPAEKPEPPVATLSPPVALVAAAAVAASETPTPALMIADLPTAQPTAVVTAPTPTPIRSAVDVLGAIAMNLLTAAARLFDLTPVTPPPGTARVGRATLTTEQAVADPAVAEQSGPLLPGATNGVTGVQVGHARLDIPGALIGDSVAADWYFPTQADGTVQAQGVIWLQHGFGATNTFYSALATELAMKTNSIVVAPTLSSIPFTLSGGCLICSGSEQAASAAFLDPNRSALIRSAEAAGYTGPTDALEGPVRSGRALRRRGSLLPPWPRTTSTTDPTRRTPNSSVW